MFPLIVYENILIIVKPYASMLLKIFSAAANRKCLEESTLDPKEIMK